MLLNLNFSPAIFKYICNLVKNVQYIYTNLWIFSKSWYYRKCYQSQFIWQYILVVHMEWENHHSSTNVDIYIRFTHHFLISCMQDTTVTQATYNNARYTRHQFTYCLSCTVGGKRQNIHYLVTMTYNWYWLTCYTEVNI